MTFYVGPGVSNSLLRHVMGHEVGHANDFARLDQGDRRRWLGARGLAMPWMPSCDACDDTATPAGDWAESFAVCRSGDTRHFRSELGPPPMPEQCALVEELVR